MKPVERNKIVDYATYEDERNAFRAEVMNIKAPRRVHIGDYITLLFENHTTIRYQIQEMVRAPEPGRVPDAAQRERIHQRFHDPPALGAHAVKLAQTA